MANHIQDLGPIQLWRLRKDIVLGSYDLNDYTNRYWMDPEEVHDFFLGYLDFLEELMKEGIPDYKGDDFFDYLDQFDTQKNLHNWWLCWVG